MFKIILILITFSNIAMSSEIDSMKRRIELSKVPAFREIINLQKSENYKNEMDDLVFQLYETNNTNIKNLLSDREHWLPVIFLKNQQKKCTDSDFKKLSVLYPKEVWDNIHGYINIQRGSMDAIKSRLKVEALKTMMNKEDKNYPTISKVASIIKKDPKFQRYFFKESHIMDQSYTPKVNSAFLKKYNINSPQQVIEDAIKTVPHCFDSHKDIDAFYKHYDFKNLYKVAKIIVANQKELYQREKKVDLKYLGKNIMEHSKYGSLLMMDPWQNQYVLQKTKNKIILRSLGPDKMLSRDDLNLGSFNIEEN